MMRRISYKEGRERNFEDRIQRSQKRGEKEH